jgi:uncharacterized protein (TIGR00369 family)
MGACMNIDQERQMVMGAEINANHIRAKRDGTVTATATPLDIGRSISVWNVQITDEKDHLICSSKCTLAVLDIK